MYFLTALEAGSPKARCWQGLAPSETSREDAPSLPFPASGGPRCSYITAVFACLPWPSSCGSSSTFPSPRRTLAHIDLGASLMISSNLITFKRLCFPIRSHPHILAVRASDLFVGPDSAPQHWATYYILTLHDTRWARVAGFSWSSRTFVCALAALWTAPRAPLLVSWENIWGVDPFILFTLLFLN